MPSSGVELRGRTIVVTRAAQQSPEMRQGLEGRGAVVLEVPVIEIRPVEETSELDAKLRSLSGYAALVLGSKNAAELVANRARVLGVELALPIACVGAKTRAWLKENAADLIGSAQLLSPESYRAEALAELLIGALVSPSAATDDARASSPEDRGALSPGDSRASSPGDLRASSPEDRGALSPGDPRALSSRDPRVSSRAATSDARASSPGDARSSSPEDPRVLSRGATSDPRALSSRDPRVSSRGATSDPRASSPGDARASSPEDPPVLSRGASEPGALSSGDSRVSTRAATNAPRVLFPRAAEGRETLIELLAARGIAVDAPVAYHIANAAPPPRELVERLATADAFTFLSGETLRAFLEVIPEGRDLLAHSKVAVIGPVAAERAQTLGIRVDLIPQTATIESLIDALARTFDPT